MDTPVQEQKSNNDVEETHEEQPLEIHPGEDTLEDHHDEAIDDPGLAEEEPQEEEAPTAEEDPIGALEAERDALQDQILRARAEFDNYRKRTARENAHIRKTAGETLIQELLPVIDNLERALHYKEEVSGSFSDGVEMVAKQLADVLENAGLNAIAATGEAFDPNIHEALAQVPSEDIAKDHIVEEFQRGYRLGDKVLRPGKVTVSSGPSQSDDSE